MQAQLAGVVGLSLFPAVEISVRLRTEVLTVCGDLVNTCSTLPPGSVLAVRDARFGRGWQHGGGTAEAVGVVQVHRDPVPLVRCVWSTFTMTPLALLVSGVTRK